MRVKTKVHIKTRQIKNKEVLNFRKKLLEKGNIISFALGTPAKMI